MDLLTNISLFSGVGGLDLAAKWTGRVKTVCYVENDAYAQGVLQSRIRDGSLEDAPIWDDVRSFDGKPWRGTDIVSGGFPCQDVSNAGKRAGVSRETRSGLFFELARIVSEVRPRYVLLENVRGLLVYPGAHRVFGELAILGHDAGWKVISASDVGALHRRERVWIVAYTKGSGTGEDKRGLRRGAKRFCKGNKAGQVADPDEIRRDGRAGEQRKGRGGKPQDSSPVGDSVGPSEDPLATECASRETACESGWWLTEPNVGRVAHGVAFRVDRLRCCGNGVVPQQALPAWEEIVRLADATTNQENERDNPGKDEGEG